MALIRRELGEVSKEFARFLCTKAGKDPDRKYKGKLMVEAYVDEANQILEWVYKNSTFDCEEVKVSSPKDESKQEKLYKVNPNINAETVIMAFVKEWNSCLEPVRMDRSDSISEDINKWSKLMKEIYSRSILASIRAYLVIAK